MKLTVNHHTAFLDFLEKQAQEARLSAAYGGRWDDGGAQALKDQIECWRAGLENRVPDVWGAYAKAFETVSDPEYAEYQRLQAKFGKS